MINIFAMGKKGLDALTGIHPENFKKINAIIIGRDSNVAEDYFENIRDFANQSKILSFPRNAADETIISEAKIDIAIGWRWIIPLIRPLVVFHDSILPQYRGFNPLVTALINGDKKIGVTALVGSDEFDEGEIIAQRIIEIDYPIKIEAAIDLIAKEYALLLAQMISKYNDEKFNSFPQNDAEASFSLWRDDEDYQIDWHRSSGEIKRMIDAVGFPYKGAVTFMDGQPLRIFDSIEFPDVTIANRTPGKVLFKHSDGHVIVCGTGLLKVEKFYDDNNRPVEPQKFRMRFK